MADFVLLDSGPLGEAAKPRGRPAAELAHARLNALMRAGMTILIPEIADYEVRRELIRLHNLGAVRRLDGLRDYFGYVPITSKVMRIAADLWAAARRSGRPTSHPHALDGDAILAAQAKELVGASDRVVIATTNVGHLGRFAVTVDWAAIPPG